MTNLLAETREAIEKSGHTPADVLFIGSSDAKYGTTWEGFESIADVEYDSGYGGAEVATDLVVVFRDGRKMWRGEYDGAEWWEYDSDAGVDYTKPGGPLVRAVGQLWPRVGDLHDPAEADHKWRAADRSE